MTGLLRQNPTITAVLCYNNVVATGAWFGLLRAGRQSGKMALRATLSSGWRWRRLPTCRRPPSTTCLSLGDHPGAGDGEKPGGFDAAAAGRGTGETRNQIMPRGW